MEDVETISWRNAHLDDLWVFDKLIVSRKLGYNCGPVGLDVPMPGNYIVRPCVNIPGMGRGAEITHIEKETLSLPTGYFWCELFNGRHISVDYREGKQVLAVEGFRKSHELWRFSKWQKLDEEFSLPPIFNDLTKRYEHVNVEYIDGKVIEVHFRHNPDFVYGNTVAYPVWQDQNVFDVYPEVDFSQLKYVKSPDFKRIGFYIDMPSKC